MLKRSLIVLVLFCGAIAACAIWAVSNSRAQVQGSPSPKYETVSVAVYQSRALWPASSQIGRQFGISVSYEDGTWVYSGDLIKMEDYPLPNRARPDLVVPAPGKLDFSFQINADTRLPAEAPEKVLQDLLTHYKERKNPGEFRLVRVGDGFSIVPDRIADLNGSLVKQSSPLESRISLPEKERDIKTTVEAIVGEIQVQSGQRIGINDNAGIFKETGLRSLSATGTPIPPQLAVVRLGATNEVGREVLARALNGGHYLDPAPGERLPKLYWSLNYDPESKAYVLNLAALR